MSSRASQWPCPQPPTTASTRWRLVQSTTAYGHRRRTGPGMLRTKLYGDRSPEQPGTRCSSSCLTKTPRGGGPGFSPSLGSKNGSRGTPCMEHIVDVVCCAPMVQILDAPVPQTVEQLPDVLQFFDTLTTDPEQVIEVPKIFFEDVPTRAVLRDPQLVEKLVEVPTIVSYSWLQLVVEFEVLVFHVFPWTVQQRCFPLKNVLLSGLWSRSLVFPVEAFKIFDKVKSSSSSHFPAGVPEALDEPGQGFFRTCPQNEKSAKSGPHSSQRVPASVSPSTPAPQHRVRLRQWVMISRMSTEQSSEFIGRSHS